MKFYKTTGVTFHSFILRKMNQKLLSYLIRFYIYINYIINIAIWQK